MTENLHRHGHSCINRHLWLAECGHHSVSVERELKGHDVLSDKGPAFLSELPEFYFEGGKLTETFFVSGHKHQPQVDVRGTAGCGTSSAQRWLPGDRLDYSTGSLYMCVKGTNTET